MKIEKQKLFEQKFLNILAYPGYAIFTTQNEAMGEDDDEYNQEPDIDEFAETECVTNDYVTKANQKRKEREGEGSAPLPFEEYLWYRKEKKATDGSVDADGNPKVLPEHEYPEEVSHFIPYKNLKNFSALAPEIYYKIYP